MPQRIVGRSAIFVVLSVCCFGAAEVNSKGKGDNKKA